MRFLWAGIVLLDMWLRPTITPTKVKVRQYNNGKLTYESK